MKGKKTSHSRPLFIRLYDAIVEAFYPFYMFFGLQIHRFLSFDLRIEKIYYGEHARQYYLICRPSNYKTNGRPSQLIWYVHGGGWRFGNPERSRSLAKIFCDQGYTVVMPTYRRIPRYDHVDILADVEKAFTHARISLRENEIAYDKIHFLGNSAGANLLGLMIYNRKSRMRTNLSLSQVSGFISVAGALNLSSFGENKVVKMYGGTDPKMASPVHHVIGDEYVSVLCVHGTQDWVVPIDASRSFSQTINEKVPNLAVLKTLRGKGHFYITTSWWLGRNALSEEILERVMEKETKELLY